MRLISLLLGRNVGVQEETEMHPVTAVHSGSLRKLHPDINTKGGEGKKIKKLSAVPLFSIITKLKNECQNQDLHSRI